MPPPPVARLIGFDLTSVKPGEVVIEFQATEAHANPIGTLHGGVLANVTVLMKKGRDFSEGRNNSRGEHESRAIRVEPERSRPASSRKRRKQASSAAAVQT